MRHRSSRAVGVLAAEATSAAEGTCGNADHGCVCGHVPHDDGARPHDGATTDVEALEDRGMGTDEDTILKANVPRHRSLRIDTDELPDGCVVPHRYVVVQMGMRTYADIGRQAHAWPDDRAFADHHIVADGG